MTLRYKGKDHDAYLSHVKVRLTASKREVYLVLVYGITEFDFENFRVRLLKAIDALNFFITVAMTFLTIMSMKRKITLYQSIISAAEPIKKKVLFYHFKNSVHGGVGLLHPFSPIHTPKHRLAMLFCTIIAF